MIDHLVFVRILSALIISLWAATFVAAAGIASIDEIRRDTKCQKLVQEIGATAQDLPVFDGRRAFNAFVSSLRGRVPKSYIAALNWALREVERRESGLIKLRPRSRVTSAIQRLQKHSGKIRQELARLKQSRFVFDRDAYTEYWNLLFEFSLQMERTYGFLFSQFAGVETENDIERDYLDIVLNAWPLAILTPEVARSENGLGKPLLALAASTPEIPAEIVSLPKDADSIVRGPVSYTFFHDLDHGLGAHGNHFFNDGISLDEPSLPMVRDALEVYLEDLLQLVERWKHLMQSPREVRENVIDLEFEIKHERNLFERHQIEDYFRESRGSEKKLRRFILKNP